MGYLNVPAGQLWESGLILALIDAALLLILSRQISPGRFRVLRWNIVGAAAVFWGVFALGLVWIFWDSYYRYFYPAWFRGGIPLIAPLFYGLLAVAFHKLALRLPGNPVVSFCLLGGIESLLEHAIGIYRLGILDVPMLQGSSPLSILLFAFPEYIFYWCIVIGLAALFQIGRRWFEGRANRFSKGMPL